MQVLQPEDEHVEHPVGQGTHSCLFLSALNPAGQELRQAPRDKELKKKKKRLKTLLWLRIKDAGIKWMRFYHFINITF